MFKKALIILIAFTVSAISCKKKNEYIIPRDEFIELMVDVHILDGIMGETKERKKFAKLDSVDYYTALLNDYGYTRKQLDSSITYYSKDLRRFDKIYQEILSRLNRMETKAEEELKAEQDQKNKKAGQTPPESTED